MGIILVFGARIHKAAIANSSIFSAFTSSSFLRTSLASI